MLGSNSIVLHGHLPFIHHPMEDDFLEEDWLFEAITETYLPILSMLDDLAADDVPVRLALGLTPPLLEMLRADALVTKARRYLENRRDLMTEEVGRLAKAPQFLAAARHYQARFEKLLTLLDRLNGDPVQGFRRHRSEGRLEILASSATHAVLPLVLTDAARRAQIRVGVSLYEEVFGARPLGFWLPECAYHPDLDPLLKEEGLAYVILEGHAVRAADPMPRFGTMRPLRLSSGVVAFGRDAESSKQVWSSEVGYPGDPHYREYYRDLGYDGAYEDLKPYLHGDGVRRNLGIKYHRVTGNVALHEKAPWDPIAARARAVAHADDYLYRRSVQIDRLTREFVTRPALLSPYDMELFGHWWYEGPWFLEALFRRAAAVHDRPAVRLITPSQVLAEPGPFPVGTPPTSTWGAKGYFSVWLNELNSWILGHQHELELRMIDLVRGYPTPTASERDLLDQLARELFLAQSSDWAFIIHHETASYYATKRFRDHVARFLALEAELKTGIPVPNEKRSRWMAEDCIFPGLDHRVFAGGPARRDAPLGTQRTPSR